MKCKSVTNIITELYAKSNLIHKIYIAGVHMFLAAVRTWFG